MMNVFDRVLRKKYDFFCVGLVYNEKLDVEIKFPIVATSDCIALKLGMLHLGKKQTLFGQYSSLIRKVKFVL